MNMNTVKYIPIVLLLFLMGRVNGQQLPMYSQYLFNDYVYNPAVAGTKPYFDVKSNHRYQWTGITDAPRTYTLSFNGPTKNQKMGLGGYLYTDIVGPTRRTGFQFSYAYHFNITDKIRMSMALSAGMLEWKLDAQKIDLYDPSDQVIVNAVMRTVVPDAKFGFYIYHDKWFFGASAPNLLRNKLSFYNAQNTGLSRLEAHYYISGGYKFDVGNDFQIQPSALVKIGLPAPIQVDLMAKVIYKKQIWLAGSYRTNDAVSAMIGYLFRENLSLGYAYDFTTTNLKKYSSGTHELMLGVRFVREKTFEKPE